MAFTDPIIAGEQLNRTGIKSDNYIPGVSGWRIASDGAAEFDNLGVRGNLWVPTITLNGQDLSTVLNKLPKGIVQFVRGYPTTSTTSEAQVLFCELDIVNGRHYIVSMLNITPDIANTKACEFRLRATFDTSSYPDNNSTVFAISLRLSAFELAQIQTAFTANYSGRIRLSARIGSLDGQNVRCWAPGQGAVLQVEDLGLAPGGMGGTVGSGASSKVLKEWTITANASRTYNGDGTLRADQYATTLVAGDWANGRGNQRAWWTFSDADVTTKLDDLVGVPQSDVVTAEIRLAPILYWNNVTESAYLSIGYHNTKNSLPAGNEPGGGIPNVYRPYVIGTGPMWFGLIPGGGVPSNFLDSMRDGYLNGFMVGNTFGGGDYAVVCEGTGGWTNYPQLHMKYWK